MDSSRRRILQLLGVSALALTTKPVFNAFAKEEQAAGGDEVVDHKDQPLMDKMIYL